MDGQPREMGRNHGCADSTSIFNGPHGPWLVAEIGCNHEGDFDAALRLADLALEAGAAAVKFHVYYGNTLV